MHWLDVPQPPAGLTAEYAHKILCQCVTVPCMTRMAEVAVLIEGHGTRLRVCTAFWSCMYLWQSDSCLRARSRRAAWRRRAEQGCGGRGRRVAGGGEEEEEGRHARQHINPGSSLRQSANNSGLCLFESLASPYQGHALVHVQTPPCLRSRLNPLDGDLSHQP